MQRETVVFLKNKPPFVAGDEAGLLPDTLARYERAGIVKRVAPPAASPKTDKSALLPEVPVAVNAQDVPADWRLKSAARKRAIAVTKLGAPTDIPMSEVDAYIEARVGK